MEIDTGTPLSLLSEVQYHQLLQEGAQLSLEPSEASLKTYTGEIFKVLGSICVRVKYENQVENLSLLVVAGEGPALLSRDWLAKLNILG